MKNVLSALAFFAKHPGWHHIADDKETAAAVRSLEARGYLEVDEETWSARYTGKTVE